MPLDATCQQLLTALRNRLKAPIVRLPFSFLVRVGCAQCKQPISVNRPEWVMASLLFCKDCGGPWDRTDKPGNAIYPTLSEDVEPLLDLPIQEVGLVPGSIIEVEDNGQEMTVELETDLALPFFSEAPENSNASQLP